MTDTMTTTPMPVAEPEIHLPRGEDFLLWPPCLQTYGYRIVDQLFATRTIRRGPTSRPLARGPRVDVSYTSEGTTRTLDEFMDRNSVVGFLVMREGKVITERYGLGLQPHDRWSTMSMVKSMTSLLVGAAIHDGAIASLDDRVAQYLPQFAGSGYAGVTVRHLLTMSSGVAWTEDYTNKNSDVNRYSKSLADKVPGGVLKLLQSVPACHAPGTTWHYNTGDTYLLGTLLAAATGSTLADYMSRKIWQPCGMEFDAFYTLESDDGQEIGGSRAGMTLRDVGRLAQFAVDDGVVDGSRVLPAGWMDQTAACAFRIPGDLLVEHRRALGLTSYGLSWWLTDDGAILAMGHSGQRLYIDRAKRLVVVNLAVYPEPRYVSAVEHDRDAELNSVIQAYRDM
jgi:CubicO group peptidase (beta-lactamase class C family)